MPRPMRCGGRANWASAQAQGADVAALMRDAADARAVRKSALARTWNWWPADRAPRYWKSGGPGRNAALLHVPLPEDGIRQGVNWCPRPTPSSICAVPRPRSPCA